MSQSGLCVFEEEGRTMVKLEGSARVETAVRLKQELAQEAKRQRLVGHRLAEDVRYGERSTAERVNGGLKDNHGGRTVRVRGPAKVMCHLMFGVVSFTALQLLRLVT